MRVKTTKVAEQFEKHLQTLHIKKSKAAIRRLIPGLAAKLP
jgi:hypothetical protein